ncbi:MAG: phosphoenolpyruvate carboxylase [Omnitrophica WOR_2 bacterium]
MSDQIVKNFEELVELNFQLYSNLFLTIPMDIVVQTGMLIPIMRDECEKGLAEGKDPVVIINDFLDKNRPGLDEKQRIDFLFYVIQYVERQILLIDALEDAAYTKIHRIDGPNTLHQFLQRIKDDHLEWKLQHFIENFGIRVVLTAHPTQFYPGQVLAIGADLTKAISLKESSTVRDLMHQLSKTPFFRKQKPTPLNEAIRLTWYLVNIFYPAAGDLLDVIAEDYPDQVDKNNQLISLGFWPGGDRDGNPFIDTETTLKVASFLRNSIMDCYLDDVRNLKRRLSFVGVFDKLEKIEEQLIAEKANTGNEPQFKNNELIDSLLEIERTIVEQHGSLFLNYIQKFRRQVAMFGYHFASLDIRQDSRVISKAFEDTLKKLPGLLPDSFAHWQLNDQVSALLNIEGNIPSMQYEDALTTDTLGSMKAMKQIQLMNGEFGCNRYIISNCRGPLDIAKVIALFKLSGWDSPVVDVVPLFETIEDLRHAGHSMQDIYENADYKAHLNRRGNKQTVMLGFSDGTKDGGYLMANWSIFLAKEEITRVSRDAGIEVIFFDGRGGPPARGGGNTHQFYSALGSRIDSRQIHLTLQGQTISSNYGLRESAVHNLGYLLTAGLSNNIFNRPDRDLSDDDRSLISEMAEDSLKFYENFKNHPLFIPFLEERSTLKYYGMANISSRPSKRSEGGKLLLEDLRAIPFVGAWSQLKQNVPGFFGLGTALKIQEDKGNLQTCVDLYQRSGFFRALISNSMQSISKSNFALTKYMESDEKYGGFWRIIFNEFELTRQMLLKVSGMVILLEDNPRSRKSIKLREKVVLPLLVIQQYALMKIQQGNTEFIEIYEKLVMRSLFGNINATRNAV